MTARIRQNNICSTSDQFGVNNVILMAFHSIICFLALPPPPAYDWKHSLKNPAKCKLEALKTEYGTNDGCVSTIWIYECWKRIPLLLMVKLSYDGRWRNEMEILKKDKNYFNFNHIFRIVETHKKDNFQSIWRQCLDLMAIINNTDINILPLATATRLLTIACLDRDREWMKMERKTKVWWISYFFATFLCLW